jgi:hypothetical protein
MTAAESPEAAVSALAPGSPALVDPLIEEIVATAPPFTAEQRRRLADLLSVTSAPSCPRQSTPGHAA